MRIRSRHFGEDAAQCNFPRERFETKSTEILRFLKGVEVHHRVIWLAEFMCDDDQCQASVGDVILYRDAGHLSHEGSSEVGNRTRFFPGLSARTEAADDDPAPRGAGSGG